MNKVSNLKACKHQSRQADSTKVAAHDSAVATQRVEHSRAGQPRMRSYGGADGGRSSYAYRGRDIDRGGYGRDRRCEFERTVHPAMTSHAPDAC